MKYSPTIFLLAAGSLGLGKGANNTTRFVRVHVEQFVLRIYETHQDENKVKYEHTILLFAEKLSKTIFFYLYLIDFY